MPGEQLTCLLHAVAAIDATNSREIPRSVIQTVFNTLSVQNVFSYSDHLFSQHFATDEAITFEKCQAFLNNVGIEIDMSMREFFDTVETGCWNICKPKYRVPLTETSVQKLWQVSNRLVDETSYPPTIAQRECVWLTTKLSAISGGSLVSREITFPEEGLHFQEFADSLCQQYFKGMQQDKIDAIIEELHSWLVIGIIQTGWLYKRTRKQANWTNWTRRWFILRPGHLEYFDKQTTRNKGKATRLGEICVKGYTKVESLSDYVGIFHRYRNRFKVSNDPVIECELAAKQTEDKTSWMSSLMEAVVACKDNLTPIQKLLKNRQDSASSRRDENNIDRSFRKSTHLQESPQEANMRTVTGSSTSVGTTFQKAYENGTTDEKTRENGTTAVTARKNGTTAKMVHDNESTAQKAHANDNSSSSNDDDEDEDEGEGEGEERTSTRDFLKDEEKKLKTVFMSIDTDGNGILSRSEFYKYIEGLGLKMPECEIDIVFNTCDKNKNGEVCYTEFIDYFVKNILDENGTGKCVAALRSAFMKADRDGSGTVTFKEFAEYMWERKRNIRIAQLFDSFANMDKDQNDQISVTEFQNFVMNEKSQLAIIEEDDLDDTSNGAFEKAMKCKFDEADAQELTKYVRQRWNAFASFRRHGATGNIVMKGGDGMVADFVPGQYKLIDLACYSDLPPLIPKHTVIKSVEWEASSVKGKSGKIAFPADFDEKIQTDQATNEHLRYYGCSFADSNQEKISLLYRSGMQDFTYENEYLDDYVKNKNGGSGIEKHEFSHLDCPLDENSGIFILAKLTDDNELHITGFKVPVRHNMYIPGGCIHSNDYLSGTWRTMLSDEVDIDHVHLTKKMADGSRQNFTFEFI